MRDIRRTVFGGQVNGSRSNGDIVLLYDGNCLLKGQSLVATSIFGHINGYIKLVSTHNIGLFSDEYI